MAYCVIGGYPVLITESRWDRLLEEVGNEKTAAWRIDARISGSWGCAADQPIYELLRDRYNKDPRRFGSEWIKFDFQGPDVQEPLEAVLEAYCDWFGHCTLRSRALDSVELTAIVQGDALDKPSGTVYELRHIVTPRHWWWKYRFQMKNRALVLKIDSGRVNRIVGAIHRFYMVYGEMIISFAEDIEIGSYVPEGIRRQLQEDKPWFYGPPPDVFNPRD